MQEVSLLEVVQVSQQYVLTVLGMCIFFFYDPKLRSNSPHSRVMAST